MTGREIILGRIREALRQPAPHPHHQVPSHGHGPQGTGAASDWLPSVGPTEAERIELFAKNSETLKTTFRVFDSLPPAAAALATLAKGWKCVASHNDPLLTDFQKTLEVSGVRLLFSDNGYDKLEMADCEAGLTTCECLVAQTGSLLVTSQTTGGRALSVLPPHHVVIATKSQLLPDLTSALRHAAEKFGSLFPSMMSFITGPSRTGDIERILVLGAHGPKELTVFLIP